MGLSAVVVLHGCCSHSAHALALTVEGCLKRMGLRSVRVVEAEFAACGYWSSPRNLVISPSPVASGLVERLLVLPRAYSGMMTAEELESILRTHCGEGMSPAEATVQSRRC